MKRIICLLSAFCLILLMGGISFAEWRDDYQELLKKGQTQKLYDYALKGGDVDLADKNGWTPLFLASLEGRVEVIKQLVARNAFVEAKNREGLTPLMMASGIGHLESVKYLIAKGADVNARTKKGGSALMFASRCESGLPVVKFLVDKGANIDARNEKHTTSLIFATAYGQDAIVRYLVERGANLEVRSKDWGWTPLIWASAFGYLEIASYLVEKGANIEVRANDGMTPLMIASLRQKSSAVKFFLSKGASFTKQDMEAVLKQISKEEMVEAGYYWDLHDAIFR